MKALVIAPQPFFTPRGTPFSVYYRTLITTQLGVEVDLLTYGEGSDVDILGINIVRIPKFKIFGHAKIGPSALKLFLDIFIAIWAVCLLVRKRYDFVHAHEEAVYICRFLKPIFRFKLVYDMHSSLPQQLVNFKFTKSKALIALFKKLEESSIRNSDAIITICPSLADYVMKTIDNSKRHYLIENSVFDPVKLATVDAEQSSGTNEERCIEESFWRGDSKCIVYAGTLEPYQGIGILIRAFRKVQKSVPGTELLIVGGTDDQIREYSELAESEGVKSDIRFAGRVGQREAQYYCSKAHVLVSPRCDGTNTPLKLYEQLASGIPLVATRIYSHTQVLDDNVAFLVEPMPDDMARGIVLALTDAQASQARATSAKQLYEAKYSRAAYTEKLRGMLSNL